MPVSKCLKKSEPLWKEWEKKAQKNGPRRQVYAVNGDRYLGEWKDNMKHGSALEYINLGQNLNSTSYDLE